MINFEKPDEERKKIDETVSPEELLNMGLMGRNFKRRPSDWKEFESDEQALAYDMAATRQLIGYDEREGLARAAEMGREIGKMILELRKEKTSDTILDSDILS